MQPSDKYISLVPAEHRGAPKFIEWLRTILSYQDPLHEQYVYWDDNFDIDYAQGAQLDKLGEIIGLSRVLNYEPPFSLSSVLDDNLYRLVLKCKIIKNMWNGEIDQLYDLWETLFNSPIIITDNQDMSFDAVVAFPSEGSIRVRELAEHGYIVPKPEAVRINFSYVDAIPLFAYDRDTPFLKGYDRRASWVEEGPIVAFAYDADTTRLKGYNESKWT